MDKVVDKAAVDVGIHKEVMDKAVEDNGTKVEVAVLIFEVEDVVALNGSQINVSQMFNAIIARSLGIIHLTVGLRRKIGPITCQEMTGMMTYLFY